MGQGGVMGRVAVAGVTILALVGVLSGGLAGAADPDFSHVTDILGGQRHLLRDDDLVIDVASGFQRYMLQTQGLQVAGQNATTVVSTSACTGLLQSRVGRLFNLPNDVIVTLAPLSTAGSGCSGSPNLGFYISDPHNAAHNSQTNFTANASLSQIALADFNGDGYADILYINQDTMSIFTARNTDDPAQGVVNVTPEGLRVAPRADPVLDTLQPEPVTGDFNGDGAIDVAWAQLAVGQWFVLFASVCPAANVAVLGETCSQAFQIIGAIPFLQLGGGPDSSPPLPFVVVAAGDYDGVLNAQGRLTHELFVVASLNGAGGSNQGHQLSTYSFDAMLTPTQRSTAFFSFSSLDVPDQAFLASGRLGWFGQQDQVVFGSWQTRILSVITFDTNLNMTTHTLSLSGEDGPLYGLAVGRFDPPDVNGTLNPNLQIAALREPGFPAFGAPAKTALQIFTVDPPNDYTPQLASTYVIANAWLFPVNFNDPHCAQCAQPAPVYGNPLQVGDLQGRSLPLGAPQKVTVTGSIQPQVVLGLPPMHLDFICDATNPGPGCTPAVLNLSALPSKYYSQYQTQQSASNQSANTNTTSYSLATKESAEAKFSYGVPDLASASIDLKTSAQQTHQNTVSNKYNTYSSKQFDVSTQTGFSDLVWFTAKRFNLYYYPVLGQTVCPQSQPDCPDAQKVPLQVVFSGPDQVIQNRIDGNLLEWYQPVQEAGNVFSYPWSITLLQDFYAGFSALTANPATVWATDSSGSTVSVTWGEGSGSSVTSGSVSTQAFDVSASVASNINIEGFGANLSAGFDYNSSSSVSTLNESSSTLGSSTGIKIVKPPFVNPGQYAYAAQTYIFGQQAPTGTVQEIPLSTTVQSSGPLWTAFVADPTDTGDGAGLWWSQAYTKPDVALNHPQRWTWTPPTPSKGDVLTFNAPNASDPAGSEFYLMKGLYITPASANGLGPQITQAAAGETLQLQARVYNYSLADMPAGSTVHVRFYGQKWDDSTHNFSGPAFVIQEVRLNPIPGFNSTSTGGQTPNWVLASATFDTANYSDAYLIFWVVVWVERNGELVPEIEGHGIAAIPGATTAPTAVAIEAYSNNVGFYRQPFFVAPQTSQRARTAAPAASSLAVDEVMIAPARVRLSDKATVAAALTTGDASLDAVPVFFYDGDPQRGSGAFDAELIPHIRANNTYVTKVKFQPRTCGQHTVVVVAGPGTAAPATGQATVDVVIDPVGSVDELITATTSLDLPTQTERSLVTKLNMAKRAFAHHSPRVATNRLTAFIGAVEVQRGTTLTDEQADSLIGEAKLIISCV